MNRDSITKPSKTYWHQWGVPAAYAILWILGIVGTTNVTGFWDNFNDSIQIAISLGIVFLLFILEIALLFADIVLQKRIKALHVRISSFFAAFVTIIALSMFCSGAYLIAPEYAPNRINISVIAFIVLSALAKGMHIWLQNNLDQFAVELNSTDVSGTYKQSFTSEKR